MGLPPGLLKWSCGLLNRTRVGTNGRPFAIVDTGDNPVHPDRGVSGFRRDDDEPEAVVLEFLVNESLGLECRDIFEFFKHTRVINQRCEPSQPRRVTDKLISPSPYLPCKN